MFLAQGTTDQIIRPDVTKNYMVELCKGRQQGDDGDACRISGTADAAQASTADVVRWIADRFSGAVAPNDCLSQQNASSVEGH